MNAEIEIGLDDLEASLRLSWPAETSAYPELWTEDNPALGQCVVTAMVVRGYFGGSLMHTRTELGGHYWNKLPDGREPDLTRRQFKEEFCVLPGRELNRKVYDKLTKFIPDLARRYRILKEAVEKNLGK